MGVIKVSLLYSDEMKQKVRGLLKGGTVKGLVLFETETAEVVDIVTSTQEAQLFCMNNNMKDDNKYASVLINLQEVVA